MNIMLRDSAHIQEFEAEWRNRKGKRAGKPEYEPVYVMQDALTRLNFLCHVSMASGSGSVKALRSGLPMWGICWDQPVLKCGRQKMA